VNSTEIGQPIVQWTTFLTMTKQNPQIPYVQKNSSTVLHIQTGKGDRPLTQLRFDPSYET